VTRLGRSALPLPRYTLRKRLKNGGFGHFFNVPSWARKKGCPVSNEALGTDYDRAVLRAEKILSPHLTAGAPVVTTPIRSKLVWWSAHWTGCFMSTAEPGLKRRRSASSH